MVYNNLAFLAPIHNVLTACGIVASGCLQIQIMVAFETTESWGFCCSGCCDFAVCHQMLLEMVSDLCVACKWLGFVFFFLLCVSIGKHV